MKQRLVNYSLFIIAFSVLTLSSCTTTGGGALTGAMFGGIIGSSIGGIGGGPHGHDIGTLVGMAVGAGTGAAIGAAAEAQEREQVREHYRSLGINARPDGGAEADDDVYGAPRRQSADNGSGYSPEPIYDDRIDFDAAPNPAPTENANSGKVPAAVVEMSETNATVTTPILIENARFINNDTTTHIAKGELVKISFEIRNKSGENLYGIVPTVVETTGNKHLLISPATMIERIPPRGALRYTAYVSAEQSLKKGTAHFQITVTSAGTQLSNVIDFDVPLN